MKEKTYRVRDMMTTEVATVHPETDVETAYDEMTERDVRHLVVVDHEGDLLGIVSHRDLLRHALIERADVPLYVEREVLGRARVREVMITAVETADPEQDLAEAARLMFENKIGCLPVVEGRRVVGILTEADFVRSFARPAEVLAGAT